MYHKSTKHAKPKVKDISSNMDCILAISKHPLDTAISKNTLDEERILPVRIGVQWSSSSTSTVPVPERYMSRSCGHVLEVEAETIESETAASTLSPRQCNTVGLALAMKAGCANSE